MLESKISNMPNFTHKFVKDVMYNVIQITYIYVHWIAILKTSTKVPVHESLNLNYNLNPNRGQFSSGAIVRTPLKGHFNLIFFITSGLQL